MKNIKIILISIAIIIAVILLFVFAFQGVQNKAIAYEEQISTALSDINVQEKRRADLIPNLVATVKGYAAHEAQTLENVVAARAKATQVTVDPADLTPEALAKYNAAQGELSAALGKLLMITESYPDLKANQNFLELQAQLEGTENRITTERMKFNETAKGYNTLIRTFPNNILASVFNFEKKGYFEAQAGAETAPKVEF
jgi:LemA protein